MTEVPPGSVPGNAGAPVGPATPNPDIRSGWKTSPVTPACPLFVTVTVTRNGFPWTTGSGNAATCIDSAGGVWTVVATVALPYTVAPSQANPDAVSVNARDPAPVAVTVQANVPPDPGARVP